MDVSTQRKTILDLLPEYQAGRVDTKTRVLVEHALDVDPRLRAQAAELANAAKPDLNSSAIVVLLRRRTLLVGYSIFFSAIPLALIYRPWRYALTAATASLFIAVIGWAMFLVNAANLTAAGLKPPVSTKAHSDWGVAAGLFLFSAVLVVQQWSGHDLMRWTYLLLIPVPKLAEWIGRRLGQLRR